MLVETLVPSTTPAVTISVPHSGQLSGTSVGIPRRLGTPGIAVCDAGTWQLACAIAESCPATLVRGLLHRSHCDYNRSAPSAPFSPADTSKWAFDHPATLPYWLAYHRCVAGSLTAAAAAGLRPLLLDLHGFAISRAPAEFRSYDIILGTGNRTTITGDADSQLASYLRDLNYHVFLPGQQPVSATGDHLNGGFTVRHIAGTLGIDAIQIEISDRFRTMAAQTARKRLAEHLAGFIRAYSC